jgi:hypothetical protein
MNGLDLKELMDQLKKAAENLRGIAGVCYLAEEKEENGPTAEHYEERLQPWGSCYLTAGAFALVRQQAGETWQLIDIVLNSLILESKRRKVHQEGQGGES